MLSDPQRRAAGGGRGRVVNAYGICNWQPYDPNLDNRDNYSDNFDRCDVGNIN